MNLDMSYLRSMYLSGALSPTELIRQLDVGIGHDDTHHVWIHRLTLAQMLPYAQQLEGKNITD